MKKKSILVGALLVVFANLHAQQEKETAIGEITIAMKIPQQLHETGKNVTLITAEQLQKYKGLNVNEVLQQVAGFQISGNFNNNQEPKSPKIRGGKQANILILLDGIPMKDVTGNDYNASDLRLLALENIESIEILNGASSVLYGSNATVSVINIKTKNKSSKKIEGNLGAKGGSFGTFGQHAALRGKLNQFYYQLNGSNEKSDGLSSAEGNNFEKDGFEKQNVLANVGYQNKKFNIQLQTGWNHHLFQYDAGAFTDGNWRGNDQQKFIGLQSSYQYKNGQVFLNSRSTTNDRLIQDFVGNDYTDQYFYEGRNIFAEVYNQYKVSKFLNTIIGVQYESQQMGSKSLPWGGNKMMDDLLLSTTKLNTKEVFAQLNLKYNFAHLDAGIRYTDHSRFGNHITYSINPYVRLENSTLYYKLGYSLATAFIAPTLYQSYGTLPYTLANPNLKPETNTSHELDMEFGKKDRTFVVSASLFQRKEQDVFVYEMLPNFTGNFVNNDQNFAKGFDLRFAYEISKKINIGANFSFIEKDQEKTMLRIPKQRLNSYIDYLILPKTKVSLQHQYVGKRSDSYWDNTSYSVKNLDLEGFNLLNFAINQKVGKHFEVFGHIGNLLNTSYVDVIGYTTKPRNYLIGFDYKF